jgi:hypothetical protein
VQAYLRRSNAHLVKLLLVVRARLGAVVRHEDQLLAWQVCRQQVARMPYMGMFPIHTFAAQHVDCLRCAWELVFAGPEHAYPSRIISLSIPVSFVFIAERASRVVFVELGMRTIAVEEEHLKEISICGSITIISATYIELVNKGVNTGLIASQVLGSSHLRQGSPVGA